MSGLINLLSPFWPTKKIDGRHAGRCVFFSVKQLLRFPQSGKSDVGDVMYVYSKHRIATVAKNSDCCQRVINMAELLGGAENVNNSTENAGEVSAVEAGTSAVSANDGRDKSLESAIDPTTNSGSLSASPVDNLEAGFYRVP